MSNSAADTELRSAAGRVGPADDRPLTEDEFKLLQRLLSDPFSFPNQYKTWLVSYLETSDLSLPIGAIQGLASILGIAGIGGGTLGILPAGIILPYGGVSAPAGALMCDGHAYSRTAQERLYKAIGTSFGSPDANNFYVPDLQERIPVGRGALADVDTLGKNEARPLGQRGPRHWHTVNDPGHHHGYGYAGGATTGGPGPQAVPDTSRMTTDEATTGISVGISGRPQDGPAFLVINFIIVN